MEEEDGRRKEIEQLLRSVLLTYKEGVPFNNLLRAYQLVTGGDVLPYRELGFNTLREMLLSMDDVAYITRGPTGEVVMGRPDQSTRHIACMVQQQRSSKAKPSRNRPARRPAFTPNSGRPARSNAALHSKPSNRRNELQPRGPVRYFPPQVGHSSPAPFHSGPLTGSNHPPRAQRLLTSGYETPPRFMRLRQQQNLQPVQTDSIPLDEAVVPNHVPVFPSSPVSSNSPSPLPSRRKYYDLVLQYAKEKDLQAIYSTVPMGRKKSNQTYASRLKLDGKIYHSGFEACSKEEAEEIAAKHAIENLQHVRASDHLAERVASIQSEEELQLLLDRIHKIVSSHSHGLWESRVAEEYTEQYHESLPPNWLKLAMKYSNKLNIEKGAGNSNHHILTERYSDSSEFPRQNHEDLMVNENGTGQPDSETSSQSESSEGSDYLKSRYIDIFVSFVANSSDIAVRLIDHCEQFESLMDELNSYYAANAFLPTKISEGELYAVRMEDSWHRVQAVTIQDNKVECYFLDHGDIQTVDANDLQELHNKFLQLQSQAIHCQLEGLEDFANNDDMTLYLTEKLLGKTLVAEVISRDDPLSVTMYDTSTEEDINLNERVLEYAFEDLYKPHIPKAGRTARAYITYVVPNGDVYIQIIGNTLLLLQDLMDKLSSEFQDPLGVTDISIAKLYGVKHTDNMWYRALVTDLDGGSPGFVEVMFVDYGFRAKVSTSSMTELELLSDSLNKLPRQAIRCRLHDITMDKEKVDHLKQLTQNYQELILKVVTSATELSLPTVEFFKRIQPTGELVSINVTLALTPELRDTENNIHDASKVERHARKHSLPLLKISTLDWRDSAVPPVEPISTGSPAPSSFVTSPTLASGDHQKNFLPATSPESSDEPRILPVSIPDVNEYFDVHIAMAATPHNFVCQSWAMGEKLSTMMQEMQQFYSVEENTVEMHEKLLKANGFYAGKHSDGLWYRVYAVNISGNLMPVITVYFVDYGEYTMMQLSDMQPLWKQFRSLPFQAIRATLHGVQPPSKDWSTMECFQFQQMVLDKQFVSIIKSKVPDTQTELGGEKLSLTLIDTSNPEKDVRLDQQLADMKIVSLNQ